MIKTYERIPGIVVFELSSSTFCINLDDVYLIKNIKEISQGEMPSQFNSGYIWLNNSEIILIDLAKYFNLPPVSLRPSSRIILINHFIVDGELTLRYGFIADKVNEIIILSSSNDYEISNFTKSENGSFLMGSLLFENKKLLMPDFAKIGSSLLDNKAKYSN